MALRLTDPVYGESFVGMIKENLVFLREFLLEFKTTGACFPTSRWAAQALIAPLRETNRKPKNILELGPGTGSVTMPMLREMRDGDTLTICEINPRFMKLLRDRLEQNEDFRRHRDRVTFFEGPAQEIPLGVRYDMIVCALPFVNFDLNTVQEIFQRLREVSSAETLMTYYEYIGMRTFNGALAPADRAERIREVNDYLKRSGSINYLARERVWLNLLPVNIYTVKPTAKPTAA
jgi:phosphatidylethanolamine/phosphatidyl-N-methylethanolamine N-methyltransferase